MKTTQTIEWALLTILTSAGIVSFGFLYYVFYGLVTTADDVKYTFKNVFPYSGETVPVLSIDSGSALSATGNSASIEFANNVISVEVNQTREIGATAIIYRGLEGTNEFRIDVMIPELDSEVFYPYRFDIRDAEKSFRLADRQFRLLSARQTYLHLLAVNR